MMNQLAFFAETCKIDEEPIVSRDFIFTMDHYIFDVVNAKLYSNFLILQFKKNNCIMKIPFLFSLLFDVLEPQQKHQKASITFFKQNKYLYLEESSVFQNLSIWKDHLKQCLNQQGFHKKYRSIKKIGKGGYATVYMMKRLQDDKIFAVKAFLKEQAYALDKGKEALINQINVLRSLDHPNVMKIQQVFQTKNSIYIVLQFIEGGSLGSKIKQLQKISLQDIKAIMKSILEGLSYLHSQNIMHRDLKPENIIFKNQKLQCVIVDFGLAQYVDTKSLIYKRCGTPGYVAPQIVSIKDKDAEVYDQKCDMFSLGIIFHQLLLKKSPFCDKNYKEILLRNRICNLDFTKLQYTRLTKQSLNLLKSLLEKDPKKRVSAKQALSHSFFSEEINHGNKSLLKNMKTQTSEYDEEQKSPLKTNEIETNSKDQSNNSYSPQRSRNRKETIFIRHNSYERFKMMQKEIIYDKQNKKNEQSKQNKQNNQTNESISSSESFRSHIIKMKPIINQKKSRFNTTLRN